MRNEERLESLEDEFETHRDQVKQAVNDLKTSLLQLEKFEDSKDRAVVNDVVENIVSKRLNQLDDLDFSDDAEELQNELHGFMADFEHMTRKEAAVMKAVPENIKLKENVEQLRKKKQEFDEFMEEEYSLKLGINELEDLEREIQDLKDQIRSIEKKLEDSNSEDLEKELEETKDELDGINDSSEWAEYQRLQEELNDAKETIVELENQEGKAVNKMERGLKKLIYRIEETELEYDGDLKLLKLIRDGEKSKIEKYDAEDIKETVKEALKSLPDSLLDNSQKNKFVEGVRTLGNLDELRGKLEEERKKISDLSDDLENHEVIEKQKNLEKRKEELEERLKEERNDVERLKEKLDQKNERIERAREEIKSKAREISSRTIEFKDTEDSS